MLTGQTSGAQIRPDLPVVPRDLVAAQIGVTIVPVSRIVWLGEQAQPAVAAAAHPRDADHVDSRIAEHLVHPVLVDHYAAAGSPDEVPHQRDTASPQPAQVTPFSESRCGAVAYVDAAEDMRHEPRAVGERGAVGDSKAAHRQ